MKRHAPNYNRPMLFVHSDAYNMMRDGEETRSPSQRQRQQRRDMKARRSVIVKTALYVRLFSVAPTMDRRRRRDATVRDVERIARARVIGGVDEVRAVAACRYALQSIKRLAAFCICGLPEGMYKISLVGGEAWNTCLKSALCLPRKRRE